MNRTLNFTEHACNLYNLANQRFGLIKRTCHFVHHSGKKRILYLTMIRSLFQHCPVVWRPSSKTTITKLESIQKRALKWINNDYSISYSNNDYIYYCHCKQINVLPIRYRFDYNDLKLFHLIIYRMSPITLPSYLKFYEGTRLRFSHFDHLSLLSDITPAGQINSSSNRGFANSYFYRTHLLWNRLPLSLREIIRPSEFRTKLIQFIWKEFLDYASEESSDEYDLNPD